MGVGRCSRTQRVFINHTRLGELFAPASRHADRKFSFPVKENKEKRLVLAEQNEKCDSIIQSWCARDALVSWEVPKFFMHAASFNNSATPGATTLSTHYFHFHVLRAIYRRCRSACFWRFASTLAKKYTKRFIFFARRGCELLTPWCFGVNERIGRFIMRSRAATLINQQNSHFRLFMERWMAMVENIFSPAPTRAFHFFRSTAVIKFKSPALISRVALGAHSIYFLFPPSLSATCIYARLHAAAQSPLMNSTWERKQRHLNIWFTAHST